MNPLSAHETRSPTVLQFTDVPEGLVVQQRHEIQWDQYGPETHHINH